ncbi:hypothetical protein [Streptomyces sp. CB01580]|uniref:hypothetical protein n=1 Tax=Streptomyces sp. CB01580 TaxID=1703933 RepID=UPI0011614339|nr:hypothetical protein [Streptomyces sp. CB01580]
MEFDVPIKRAFGALGAATVLSLSALLLTAPAAQADSGRGCTKLTDKSGGTAEVCKTWTATDNGYYKGTWSIGVMTSYTYVELSKDKAVSQAIGSSGSYPRLKEFWMRACSSLGTGCSAWW